MILSLIISTSNTWQFDCVHNRVQSACQQYSTIFNRKISFPIFSILNTANITISSIFINAFILKKIGDYESKCGFMKEARIFGATPHGFLKQEYLDPHGFITIGGNAWLICKNQCGGFPPHLNIHRHSHHFHSHQQYQHFQLHHHHHAASW